jgi:hypothetical protein
MLWVTNVYLFIVLVDTFGTEDSLTKRRKLWAYSIKIFRARKKMGHAVSWTIVVVHGGQ